MQSTGSALRNTHWLFIAVLSLLWLWPSRPARADFYGEAIPSTAVREYYYADDSGLIYRGGIALRDPLGVHARNAQLAALGLSARLAQCGRVQEAAVRYGKGIWEESHRQCLEEKKHEGLSLDEAMESCGAHNFPLLN